MPTLPPASSAQAPQPKDETIVVTGSRIPHPNLTATSPLTVVSSEEVKLEGAVLTETLINALPQVKPDQGDFISNGATGTATVDLRALGPSRSLVLINGRRLLPGDANYPAPDINFVPSSLIKRVEVLTGGASSVYGSDAVAGVVNFILDTKLKGIRIDGQTSFYQHDDRNGSGIRSILDAGGYGYPIGSSADGAIKDINIAAGTVFAHDRGHVTIYGGYRQITALSQDARDYSACSVTANDPILPPACGGSTTSVPGTFLTQLRNRYHVVAGRLFAPGRTLFNPAPFNYYQRPGRRTIAGGFADFEVSPAFNPYVELMYMLDKTTAQIAPSGAFSSNQRINCDNPLLSAQQQSIICANGNLFGQTPQFDSSGNLLFIVGTPRQFIDPITGNTYYRGRLVVSRRNIEGGPRQEIISHRDWRAVGGFKGEPAAGISYDASLVHGSVKNSDFHTNDLLTSRIGLALDVVSNPSTGQPVCRSVLTGADPNCVPWDIFSPGAVSPAAAAYLTVPSRLAGSVEQTVGTADITADLGTFGIESPWADNAPALNFGLEYRKDKLEVDPDEHYQNADLSGLGNPILALKGSTSVKELFGEVRVPLIDRHLVENLTLEAGYRLSWYSNPQRKMSSSSYKLGIEFTPIRGIRLRASQQHAVRAANVQELFSPVFQTALDTDPCVGVAPTATLAQCATTGVTPAQYGHLLANPLEDLGGAYNAITGGNAGLDPERATTRTIGLVFQPRFVPGFSATVDWFNIRLNGAISTIGAQLIMDTCIATGDPTFCGKVHRDAEGSLWLSPEGYVDDRNANIAAFETSGIDVGASYTHSLGSLGSASFEFTGTWTHKFFIDPGGLSISYDCGGLYGQVCGFAVPRWRHNARATLAMRNGLSLSLMWRHVSPVPVDTDAAFQLFQQVYNPVAQKIPAQEYFDLTGQLEVARRLTFRFGVRNIFDREPPIVASGVYGACSAPLCNGNTFPQLYDPLGRFIFFGATLNLF